MRTAVIILGHGSRREGAGDQLDAVAAAVRRAGGYDVVEHAFLQHAKPDVMDVIDRCAEQGIGRIVIVPFFLLTGSHVASDIPALVDRAGRSHSAVSFVITEHVGAHPLMADIIRDLVGRTRT